MQPARPLAVPIRPLVLIVGSRNEMRAFEALALSALGFDVLPSSTSEDAAARVGATRPDVVVLEILQSDASGWRVAHSLKRDSRTRRIPIVIVTDRPAEVFDLAEDEGCAAVLRMPYRPDQLALALRDFLEQHEAVAARASSRRAG
jgi:CheY-like chemotaxis protein